MKMKKSIEVEGNTVREAVSKALDILKLSSDQVKIEILCEEKKGLFGKESARLAKVRASVVDLEKGNSREH